MLSIKRTNTDGFYHVYLQQYFLRGQGSTFIRRNELVSGTRRLRVSCEAKALNGAHLLNFAFRDMEAAARPAVPAQREIRLAGDNRYQLFVHEYALPAGRDFQLRIEDTNLEAADSSIQIKDLLIEEFHAR